MTLSDALQLATLLGLIAAGIVAWCLVSAALSLLVGKIIDHAHRQIPTGLNSSRKIHPDNIHTDIHTDNQE